MPRKKKSDNVITDAIQELEQDMEHPTRLPQVEAQEPVTIPPRCGHQNRHYTGGELFCDLPANHGGNHEAYLNGKATAWSDEAGTAINRKHG